MRRYWRELIFFLCKQILIVDSFLVRDASLCSLPLFIAGPQLAWTCYRPCECCPSLCEFTRASVLLCLQDTVSMQSSVPSALTLFLHPLLHRCLGPEREDLKTSHVVLSAAKSLLTEYFPVPMLVPIYYKKKLLWGWLSETLIYWCSRMSLGVTKPLILL